MSLKNFLLHAAKYTALPITGAVAHFICIIVESLLLRSLLFTFKRKVFKTELKSVTISACLCYVLWHVSMILSLVVIPRHLCEWRIPIGYSSFFATRAALYYFFIVRTQLSFDASPMALSKGFCTKIKICICSVYSLSALCFIICGQFSTYNDGLCTILLPTFRNTVIIAWCFTDSFLFIFCVAIYIHRLFKVHASLRQHENINMDINHRKAMKELTFVMKKQMKLAFTAFLTTVLLMYLDNVIRDIISIMYLDGAVNVFCVYCTFKANHRYYECICNCNGNKCLQFLCCSCCYCCNTEYKTQQDANGIDNVMQLKKQRSDAKEARASTNSTNSSQETTESSTPTTTLSIALNIDPSLSKY